MYIYTSTEIKQADAEAADKGMTLFALMENAGAGLFHALKKLINKNEHILILSGRGNNGGDAIVLARYLKNHGYRATLAFPLGEPKTTAAKEHYAYFQACGYEAKPFSAEMNPDWIVDSLLGVGSQLPLRGDLAKITSWINQSQKKVVAVDVPTGVASDKGEVDKEAVRAAYTFALHGYKPSAFLFPSSEYYGEAAAVDIGIPQTSRWRIWSENDVQRTIPKRSGNTHKGTFGTALLIAGSDEMPGSAALAAIGALRFGTGKLSIATTKHASTVIAPLAPEATFQLKFSARALEDTYSAAAIGPGLIPGPALEKEIRELLKLPIPILLDAGALSERKYPSRKAATVITPHPGEFSRLTGAASKEIQSNRLEYASRYAKEHHVTVVLKGKYTVIAFPDGSGYINPTGNRALSKGGTGDTLTGMLLAALGTYECMEDGICNAVYIHGACADEWVKQNGEETMTAHDFARLLPKVCKNFN